MVWVLGFAFNTRFNSLVMILKNRPDFLKGKWNVPGGKIDGGENPMDAMKREFREETGVTIGMWYPFGELITKRGKVLLFTAANNHILAARKQEDELVQVLPLALLSEPDVMPNLRWMVDMALNHLRGVESKYFSITEHDKSLTKEEDSVEL